VRRSSTTKKERDISPTRNGFITRYTPQFPTSRDKKRQSPKWASTGAHPKKFSKPSIAMAARQKRKTVHQQLKQQAPVRRGEDRNWEERSGKNLKKASKRKKARNRLPETSPRNRTSWHRGGKVASFPREIYHFGKGHSASRKENGLLIQRRMLIGKKKK